MCDAVLTEKDADLSKHEIPFPRTACFIDIDPVTKQHFKTEETLRSSSHWLKLFVANFIIPQVVSILSDTNFKIIDEIYKITFVMSVNVLTPLLPSAAYMRHWIGSRLIQIMVWRQAIIKTNAWL